MMGYLAAGKALAVMSAGLTHPDYATLDHPLFAVRKEGSCFILLCQTAYLCAKLHS